MGYRVSISINYLKAKYLIVVAAVMLSVLQFFALTGCEDERTDIFLIPQSPYFHCETKKATFVWINTSDDRIVYGVDDWHIEK
jgi:hypothetical protein